MTYSYDIERYLNIRSAHSASFSPDGEKITFLMNTTGVPQIWELDEPGRWPEQLTFYDERVTFATWSPEKDELIFGMDEGGNERAQFFRLDGDGRIFPLTKKPEAKHRWGGWNSDGTKFAFTSNRRDESVFDVYVQERDEVGDEAELVHEGDGWLSVGGWSPSDDRLIVSEAHSSFDQDVYVFDLESQDLRHVTPHEGDVRYISPSWSPDGESLYLVTDKGEDKLYFARIDLDSLEVEKVVDGDGWNIESAYVDDETGRLIYSRNVDGYNELTVGELVSENEIKEFPEPELPDAIAGGYTFDPDAERFAVTVTGSDQNANIYIVDIETGEAEKWTQAPTAGIPPSTFISPELIHYESFDGIEIPAFLSLPDESETGDEYPVIVDIHGGPESQRRPSFNSVKQYFLNNGYAFFEPNVRGSTGYGKEYTHLDDVRKRMDSVRDIKEGVEWLKQREEVDKDRIVAMGGSYGGFMVLASLTEYPDIWAAGVDIVGIANFVTFLENTGEWRRELREAEYGSLEEDREFLEEISPTNNIEKIRSPLLVLHGANDPRVPVGEAEQIAEKASEQGVPVEKLIFDDEGHGFTKLENRIEANRKIVDFLDKHV